MVVLPILRCHGASGSNRAPMMRSKPWQPMACSHAQPYIYSHPVLGFQRTPNLPATYSWIRGLRARAFHHRRSHRRKATSPLRARARDTSDDMIRRGSGPRDSGRTGASMEMFENRRFDESERQGRCCRNTGAAGAIRSRGRHSCSRLGGGGEVSGRCFPFFTSPPRADLNAPDRSYRPVMPYTSDIRCLPPPFREPVHLSLAPSCGIGVRIVKRFPFWSSKRV